MGIILCEGGKLTCSWGAAPSPITVLSDGPIKINNLKIASIQDCKPMVNIMPFGMCFSMANPAVAAATAARFGVLTPMPCVPAPLGMWQAAKPQIKIGGMTCVSQGDCLMCAYAGCISVLDGGQNKASII